MVVNAASEGFGRIRAPKPVPELNPDVLDRIADADRQDNALVRMVLAAALATALLALAGGLVA